MGVFFVSYLEKIDRDISVEPWIPMKLIKGQDYIEPPINVPHGRLHNATAQHSLHFFHMPCRFYFTKYIIQNIRSKTQLLTSYNIFMRW